MGEQKFTEDELIAIYLETKSLSEATRRLGVSPPAIFKRLSKITRRWQITL